MSKSYAERIESERDFHNKRFSDEPDIREPINHWYAAVGHGRENMKNLIRQYSRSANVLEYGVADGGDMEFQKELAKIVSSFHGIDISEEAIAHITQKTQALGLKNFNYTVMNAESLQFPDNTFDLIFGTGILHHLDLGRAYAEMSRVLRPGGHAVFFEPMGHNPILNAF